MADTIRHQGIVENINGTHLQVRIVQTSACASCSIKGHCSSADTKEKLIDVIDESSSYQPGDRVWVVGELSMGVMAVLLAFVFPFLVLIFSLFAFKISERYQKKLTAFTERFVRYNLKGKFPSLDFYRLL